MNTAATKQQQQPPPPRKNRLAAVVTGRLTRPIRLVMYATDGVGKSTFASNAPSPIFIGAEDGTAQLDVKRMPDVHSWSDIGESLAELEQGEHSYQTAVLDTADWAEPMCWAHLCKTRQWADIEEPGFGKGYNAALDEWRHLLARFERIRARGMNVIILAHCVIRTFKNPAGDDFDRYEMALNNKASGLLRQWADCVLFAQHETFAVKESKKAKAKGVSSGARIMHTQRTAAWDAKNRYDLPEELPLDWQTFADAVDAHRPADPSLLRARITGMLINITDDALTARVNADLSKAGDDAARLAHIADKLAAKLTIKENEQ